MGGIFGALMKLIGGGVDQFGATSTGKIGPGGVPGGGGSLDAMQNMPSMGTLMGSMGGGGGGGKPYKDTKEDDYALSMRPLSLYKDMQTPTAELSSLNGLTGLANQNQPRVLKQQIPNGVIQMMLQRMRGY